MNKERLAIVWLLLIFWSICTITTERTSYGPRGLSTGIRLVDGRTPYEGRVEIKVGLLGLDVYQQWGRWGTVCDDHWSKPEAVVVCRQLGFTNVIEAIAIPDGDDDTGTTYNNPFSAGPESMPIHIKQSYCSGSEQKLQSCSRKSEHHCSHFEDAGVRCRVDTCRPGPCQNGGTCREYVSWSNYNAHCTCTSDYTGVHCEKKIACSAEKDYCWPGDCDEGFASRCQCRPGFIKYGDASSGRRCRLLDSPDLNTCRMTLSDHNGQDTLSLTSGPSTNCASQQDAWIRTQPANVSFTIKADFNMSLGELVHYVNESYVGIVGASIRVVQFAKDGSSSQVLQQPLNSPQDGCQQAVSETSPTLGGALHDCEGVLPLFLPVNLTDGERVCTIITAIAGGYYILEDDAGNNVKTETFPMTQSDKQICFNFDKTKPVHCTGTSGSCTKEPLKLSTRFTRHPEVEVTVDGWLDPLPIPGKMDSASGIHLYRLEVHGVDVGSSNLSMQDDAKAGFTKVWNASSSSPGGPYQVTVTLPEDDIAQLYALILEVHDKAGNVGYARRLLLLDNSSSVELWPSASVSVIHANSRSHNRWQTDVSKELCVNWTRRFYNTDMYNNNFLMKVDTDNGREIYGHYDQIVGPLAVKGTDNVIGVTQFELSWQRDQSPRTPYTRLGHLFTQSQCLQEPLHDGETYDVWIRATDVMNNTNEDSVRVSIDHSGPEVSVQGLRGRWDRERLYVHNNTDLSTMTLVLTAADPHSGLDTMHWTLGTRPLADDVGHRAVGVQRLDNVTSCNGEPYCYCPSVGDCERHRYLVTFTNLVQLNTHQGDHHRDYHVTITVTNKASLSTTTTFDILLDESPPTVGVVWEGLSDDGQAEMDFTSYSVVHVRWHGYQDHESGVLLYRVVMGERCMSKEEVDTADNATEVNDGEMTSFTFPKEGQYYVSVVAYNGALEPSEVACSDGILYDTTPPTLHNVSLTHARSGQTIGCTQSHQAWLVNANLTRVALHNSSLCHSVCSGQSTGLTVDHLPLSSQHVLSDEVSEHYCRTLPKMSEDSTVVLPSDYLRMTWQGRDEESQIEEYYIGMGSDLTSFSAPDLLPFTATHGHTSYHARHAGLGHGDLFFAFLQVVNKAGLTTTLNFGPVLIDVTPPDVTRPLTAVVEEDFLVVTWQDGVFVDPEQPKNAEFDVSYRIGHEGGFVTPFLTLPASSLSHCVKDNVTGCARYPIKGLYVHDSEYGRSFFFQVHVTNAAGHVTAVNTSSVRLPAHYPPSHAVIMDVVKTATHEVLLTTESPLTQPTSSVSASMRTDDSSHDSSLPITTPTGSEMSTASPEYDSSQSMTTSSMQPMTSTDKQEMVASTAVYSGDVDAILQQDEICVAWKGFYHEEDIEVVVGVGTKPDQDDLIQFHVTNGDNPYCLNVTSAPTYTKLFSVVRATSTGGTAVFSSDGFVIVPKTDPQNEVKVFNGQGCREHSIVGMGMLANLGSTASLTGMATIPVHAGDVLFIEFSPFVPQVTFTDAILLQTTLTGYQVVAQTPNITAEFPVSMATNVSVQIVRCQKDSSLVPLFDSHVTFTWEISGPWTPFVKHFKTEIMDTTCLETSPKKDKYLHQLCSPHREQAGATTREMRISLNDMGHRLSHDHSYVSSVSPCFDDGCLPAVTSRPVFYTNSLTTTVHFNKATILDQTMQQLTVDVQALVQPETGAERFHNQTCVFLWTVSRDRAGSVPLVDWMVQDSPSCSTIEIQDQVRITGNGEGTIYMCLRLVYPWTTQDPTCVTMVRTPSSNTHDPHHIIELSHSTFRQTDFEPYLHSQQLGAKLHELYDLDLDFASSDVMLSAVLTFSEGVNVTWFLMTSRHVPDAFDCAGDAGCVTSRTSTSHVTFPRHLSKLQSGEVYYVCAALPEHGHTPVTSHSQTIKVCGDGVVIDDNPPTRGSAAIDNADRGYLADRGHVMVTWSGFADVEVELPFLHDTTVTLNYSVALGSYPGAEDLAPYRQVGQRTSWSFTHLNLTSGITCIATVRAQDRVGHVTEVSSTQVVIDNTPPVVGHVAAGTITVEEFVPGGELPVHWEDVKDLESGVHSIEVGVAEKEGGATIIDLKMCEGGSTILTDTSVLVDGHSYVVLLKVTNGAGLTTLKSSSPFVVDSSPPSPGHMWHSGSNNSTVSGYSSHVGEYSVRWSGFTDPHSDVDYFMVGLGSSPGHTDVVPFVYVGRQTAYTWKSELDQGFKFYATLRTCNRAGLCLMTSSGSLIFDDSPPTSGHVTVGLYGSHDKFLGHNSSVPVQWTGFSDPQTGIQHFTWCVGLSPRVCEVIPASHTLLSRAAHKADVTLPLATPLYVTVRAVNPVGLETVSVSDSFVVDSTPPEIIRKPHFLSPRDGSPVTSQWDRSVLRVAWLFEDPDSSVVSHTVYIRSQLTGKLLVDPIFLGADTQLTIQLDKTSLLSDGDVHWTSVSACNAAHLCVMATSDVILIDSTPPITGTFLSPLHWTQQTDNVTGDVITTIDVSWRAFRDAESELVGYELMAGRRYNGEEISGGRVRVKHDNGTQTQHNSLKIRETLEAGDVLHLAVLAFNDLHLHSPLVRMAFHCLHHNAQGTSGTLVLIRHSCEASYCTKECTCAAAGEVCKGNTTSCIALNPTDANLASFKVMPFMGISQDLQRLNSSSSEAGNTTQSSIHSSSQSNVRNASSAHSPATPSQMYVTSATCLEGYWTLAEPEVLGNVSRFEFSFSLVNMSAGEGIFDAQKEPVWYDVGRHMTAVHCMPGNRTLLSGERYVLHVRVWPSRDSHVTFVSSPVVVDHTPPQIKRGRAVLDSDVTCSRDVDYVTSEVADVTACWDGVFRDSQSGVVNYQVWVGTSPRASNHHPVTDVGLNTTWTFPAMHLEPGTRYYVTVRAQNAAGLQTTSTSDGFLVDVTPPLPGVVFASGRYSSRHAQSSTSSVSASWHGFEDRHAGVTSYHVGVYDADNVTEPVVSFVDVGVRTEVELNNLTLVHGHSYKVAIKARDAAGLESKVVHSAAILIDVTPPEGVTCTQFLPAENLTLTPTLTGPVFAHTYLADTTINVTEAGQIMTIDVTVTGGDQSVIGYVSLAELKMPLSFHVSATGEAKAQHSWLSPYEGEIHVKVMVEGPAQAQVTAQMSSCVHTAPSTQDVVIARQTSAHTLSVCSRVRDKESGLGVVMVGVGTTPGGLQLQPWTRLSHSGHFNIDLHVQHATTLYASLVTQNHAGLWSRFISQPIVFDRTGPVMSEVTVTLQYEGEGRVNRTGLWAEVRWTAEDEESDLDFCTCHLEGHPTVQSPQQRWGEEREGECSWQLKGAHHGAAITVTVDCFNAVLRHTSVTSHPVTVLIRPPDVSEVGLRTLSNNPMTSPYTESSPQVRSHNSSLQFSWRPLLDPTASDVHLRFLWNSLPLTEWRSQDTYKTMAVMDIAANMASTGVVIAQLTARNDRNMTSSVVTMTTQLNDEKPTVIGKATASLTGDELLLDWRHVFHVTRDVTFSLFAGTEDGYGDVINHVTTSSTHYRGHCSKTLTRVFVTVTAVYDNGLFSIYMDSLNV